MQNRSRTLSVLIGLVVIATTCLGQQGAIKKALSPYQAILGSALQADVSTTANASFLSKSIFSQASQNFLDRGLDQTQIRKESVAPSSSLKAVYFHEDIGGILVQLDPVEATTEVVGNDALSPGESGKKLKMTQFSAQYPENSSRVKIVCTIEGKEIKIDTDLSLLRLAAIVSAQETPYLLTLAANSEKEYSERNLSELAGLAINPAIAVHNLSVVLLRLDDSLRKVMTNDSATHYVLAEKEWKLDPESFSDTSPFRVVSVDHSSGEFVDTDLTARWMKSLDELEKRSLRRFGEFLQTYRLVNALNRGYVVASKGVWSDKEMAELLRKCEPHFKNDLVNEEDERVARTIIRQIILR